MRRAARAIVIHSDKLLVMHRNKFGQEYESLPGGVINIGEPDEQAAVREVAEEATVKVTNPRLVYVDHAGTMYGDQLVFLCDFISGEEPKLAEDTHEYAINKMGQNLYEPRWVSREELEAANFVSEELKKEILDGWQNGWPEKAKEFTSHRS